MPFKLNINDSRAHLFISLIIPYLAIDFLPTLVALETVLGFYFLPSIDSDGYRLALRNLVDILNKKMRENEYLKSFVEAEVVEVVSKVPKTVSYKNILIEALEELLRDKKDIFYQEHINALYDVCIDLGHTNPKRMTYSYVQTETDWKRKLKRLATKRGIAIEVADDHPFTRYIRNGKGNPEDLIDDEELKKFLATFKKYQDLLKEKHDPSDEVKDQIFLKAMSTRLGDNLSGHIPQSVLKTYYRKVNHELRTQEKADSLFEDLKATFFVNEFVRERFRVYFVPAESVVAFDRIKLPEAWGVEKKTVRLQDGRYAFIVYQDVCKQLKQMKVCVESAARYHSL